MMLSDPESDFDSSFDGVDVGDLPADPSTFKSSDDPLLSNQSSNHHLSNHLLKIIYFQKKVGQ